MNNMLEKRAVKIKTFIKGTDIAVLNSLHLDVEKTIDIKDAIEVLRKEKKQSFRNKYITVEPENDDWELLRVYDSFIDLDEDTYEDSDNFSYYEIIKGDSECIIDIVNEWLGEVDKYKTEEEVLNCEEFQGEIYKIREGLYLMNVDSYY
jgi:hypothetical protein